MARAIPLEKGFQRVFFTGYSHKHMLGFKAIRFPFFALQNKGRIFVGRFSDIDKFKATRYRNVGAVVEREIFRRIFVEFVDLRKADIGLFAFGNIAVGVDTRIDLAFFGIVVPRAVEIAPHEHKRNHKKHKSNHAVSYSSSLEAILSSRNNTHS